MTKPPRKCSICGKPMPGAFHLTRACSKACRLERKRRGQRKPVRSGRACLICGTNIDGTHHNTKLCSDNCRQKQNRTKAAESRHRNRDKIIARTRAYKARNRAKLREKARTYYWAKRDEIREKDRQRRADPSIKKAAQEYRRKNSARLSKQRRAWYAANLERERENARNYKKNNPQKVKLAERKHRVKLSAAYKLLKELGLFDAISTAEIRP